MSLATTLGPSMLSSLQRESDKGLSTQDRAAWSRLSAPEKQTWLLPNAGHPTHRFGRQTDAQRQRHRQGWRSLLPEPGALAGAMMGSAAGACLLQHQHPNPAARAACVPGRARSQPGTQRRPRPGASPSLPFPSLPGWQAVKAPSPRLGCQGERASGRKRGAGPAP